MIGVVFYILIPILALIGGIFFYTEVQRKKAYNKKKKEISFSIQKIRQEFKKNLQEFNQGEVITRQQLERIYVIINNYFVFQPVNDQTLQQFSSLAENLYLTIYTRHQMALTTSEKGLLIGSLLRFTNQIPGSGNQFTREFYAQKLPEMIKQLRLTVDENNKKEAEAGSL